MVSLKRRRATMIKLIVEMEMPENCSECYFSTACSFCEGYDDVCVLAPKDAEYKWNFSDGIKPSERPSWCPIVGVLPDEHGDLIDRDIMYKQIQLWESTATDTITMGFLYYIEKLLMCIRPTIVAERKDDEQTD